MDFQLLSQLNNRGFKFLILEDYLFSLFALILELAGELVVLEHSESCCGLQLFFFQAQQVLSHLSDFVSHF